MNKKQELIDYVIGNEFITKPSLQDKFTKLLDEALAEQLILHGVVDSKLFTETDLLNGYQAGCIEGLDDCCDLGFNDLKEIKEDGKKWVKRYTE